MMYHVVQGLVKELSKFRYAVAEFLDDGWELQGGCSVAMTDDGCRIFQAIKKEGSAPSE